MTLRQYLQDHSGQSERQIALAAGIQTPTLTRQLSGENRVRLETVVAIHRVTDLPLLDLLVAANAITDDEARAASAGSLRNATDEELALEVLRRARAGHEAVKQPIDNVAYGPWDSGSDMEIPEGAAARRNAKAKKETDDDWESV